MRFSNFILPLLFLAFCPLNAWAQQTAIPFPEEWNEEEAGMADLGVQPLSLEDLEEGILHPEEKIKKSSLEKAYSDRIVDEVSQFGYDIFNSSDKNLQQSIPAGLAQDDYILSAGDTLDIILRGQKNIRSKVKIDNKGMLIIDDFTPLQAASKSIEEVREALENEASAMHNTQIYVSLADVRQIGVLVVGNVKEPGRKTLTSFHTVMDALNSAGGIDKTGSLRRIKLIRDNKTYSIDLYHLLIKNGGRADMLLQDGDRLVVPPIGPTVAVSGFVKRAGIYEILEGETLSLKDMLGLGGDIITPGDNRFIKLDFDVNGEEKVQDVADRSLKQFNNGSILMVSRAETSKSQSVELEGHTRKPGTHALNKDKSLSDLIDSPKVLGSDIYPLMGVIVRRDPKQLTKTLIPFSPQQVVRKEFDQALQDEDEVHLFSMTQIRNLEKSETPEPTPLLHKVSAPLNTPKKSDTHVTDPLLTSFLSERAAFVRGAVRVPGAYPVSDGTTLENLISVAGGITLEANTSNIEITSRQISDGNPNRKTISLNDPESAILPVNAGDTVRVNQTFQRIEDKSVMILGEVARPGRYDLTTGDTMSALIDRAGGLTPHAYAQGAIFSRASERKAEENRYDAQARDLEMKLAASLQQTDDDKKPDMAQISAVQNLIAELKEAKALGRITVETDPGVLSTDPEQDILLEAGDKIFIPKRPLTVRVAGEVLSPAALQFRKDKDPADYIREAGGTTYYADKDRSFVVYPDGSAEPLHISSWQHNAVFIPPGSTIIVPRDPEPFNFLDGAERVSQILANLAISGLYIEAIGDDD